MDRWSDRDDDASGKQKPMGTVARGGLGAFVKSSQGMTSGDAGVTHQPATVTLSRREQAQAKQAADSAVRISASLASRSADAPPAQPKAPPQANGSAPTFQAPSWAVPPPAGTVLQIFKNGALVDEVKLHKPATVFGRIAGVDVQLDHLSISRQHAVVAFRAGGQPVLMDLNSAHGSFVDGNRLAKLDPLDLEADAKIQFGASTRQYVIKQGAVSRKDSESGLKRSVQWPDDNAGPDKKRRSGGLEQVIGYTDSKPFSVSVGPVAAEGASQRGQFADAVSPVVRPSPAQKPLPPQYEATAEQSSAGSGAAVGGSAAAVKRRAQEEFKKFMESRARRSSSLFDDLPPPSSAG